MSELETELRAEIKRLQEELDDRTGRANVRMMDQNVENKRLRTALQALLEGCYALNENEAVLPQQMQKAHKILEEK